MLGVRDQPGCRRAAVAWARSLVWGQGRACGRGAEQAFLELESLHDDSVVHVRGAGTFPRAFKCIILLETHLRQGLEADWKTTNLLSPEWRGSRMQCVFLPNLKPKQPFVKEQTNKQKCRTLIHQGTQSELKLWAENHSRKSNKH